MARAPRVALLLAVALVLLALWRPDPAGSVTGAGPASAPADAVPRGGDLRAGTDVRPVGPPEDGSARIAYGAPPSGARISGRVVDPVGEPVARASVTCSHAGPVNSDEVGQFSLDALPAGEHRLWAEAPGFASRPSAPVRVARGAHVADVALVLEPARPLAGRVLADGGARVVEGATVQAVVRNVTGFDAALPTDGPWSRPQRTASGPHGEFRLEGLPDGRVELTVTHPDHASFGRLFSTGAEDLRVVLTRAGSVSGRVVHEDGRPAAIDSVQVLVSADDPAGPWRRLGARVDVPAEDAALGVFRVRPRTHNWLRVAVAGPGFRLALSEPFQLDAEFAHAPLLLRARDGPRLTGRAFDERGHPVADAEVVAIALDSTGLSSNPTRTLSDGGFVSPPLAPGNYRVVVRRDRHFSASVEPVRVDEREEPTPLEVELRRASALRGRVVARLGGALPDLLVRAVPLDPGRGKDEQAEVSDAVFVLPRLEPGRHRAQLVRGDGALLCEVEVELAAGEEHHLVLDLDEGGGANLTGTLTWNGAPAASAVVTLGGSPGSHTWRCTTDRAGVYRFAGVTAGTFLLSAHVGATEDYIGSSRASVTAGEEARYDLFLTTGALSGRAVVEHRGPLAGPRIWIEQDFGDLGVHRIAGLGVDPEGRFESAALPAGPLLLSTSFDYSANVRREPIAIRAHAETTLDELILAPAGSVAIHVKRPSSTFLSSDVEVEVRRLDDGTLVRSQRFARGERLVLDELPAASVDVLVRCVSDGSEANAFVDVVAGRPCTAVVQF